MMPKREYLLCGVIVDLILLTAFSCVLGTFQAAICFCVDLFLYAIKMRNGHFPFSN